MKAGFTLIELALGLFLSSLISLALYNSFFVSNRTLLVADDRVAFDFRIGLVQNQLDRDFSGVFVPVQLESKSTSTIKPIPSKEGKEESKLPPLEKVFYSTNAKNSLDVLTFISNNPMKAYEIKKQVKPKPRIVRVVYRLVPSNTDSLSFKLMRQEGDSLDYKNYEPSSAKSIRPYELIDGIKSMKLEYEYPLQQEKKVDTKSSDQPQKPEYKSSTEWVVDPQNPEEKPQTPQFIKCTLELWDSAQKDASSIVFDFEIVAFNAHKLLVSTSTTPTAKIDASIPPKQPQIPPVATPSIAKPQPPTSPMPSMPVQDKMGKNNLVERLNERLKFLKVTS